MGQPAADEDAPRVGRPRDPRVDDAIRQATLELLVEDGYQATTIQAIARRAGVSAPSVYRRWSSKAELIEEAVFPSGLLAPEARSGDVITDLQPYCLQILTYLADPPIRAAIPGLLVEYQNHPDMWRHSMERSFFPMRTSFDAYLEKSGRRPVVSTDALFDVMVGALFTRALNYGAEDAAAFAQEVAQVITAALQPTSGRKGA
ncbi:MAG: TetR/AcrR family transcriptional regulator [Mycobacteriales bacterium]